MKLDKALINKILEKVEILLTDSDVKWITINKEDDVGVFGHNESKYKVKSIAIFGTRIREAISIIKSFLQKKNR